MESNNTTEQLTLPQLGATEIEINDYQGYDLKCDDLVLATINEEYFTFSFADLLKKVGAKLLLKQDPSCKIEFTPIEEKIMDINMINEIGEFDENKSKWTHLNISRAKLYIVGNPNTAGYHCGHEYKNVRVWRWS